MDTTTDYKGYTITLWHDPDCESPREYASGTFIDMRGRSSIGDEQIGPGAVPLGCPTCGGAGVIDPPEHHPGAERLCPHCGGDGAGMPSSADEHLAMLIRSRRDVAGFLVGRLEHSGTALYLDGGPHWGDANGWDSGTAGFYLFSAPGAYDVVGATRLPLNAEQIAKLREVAKGELETYATWLNGGCVGFMVTDDDDDIIESVGGFYSTEDAEQEATAVIDGLTNEGDSNGSE